MPQNGLAEHGELGQHGSKFPSRNPSRHSANLHNSTVRQLLILLIQNQGRANHAFRTGQPNLNETRIINLRRNGNQTPFNKVDTFHWQSPMMKDLPGTHLYLFGNRQYAFSLSFRNEPEELVFEANWRFTGFV